MILAQPTPGHPGPNLWIRIGAFNLAVAITAGAFVGIGLRTLLLAGMDRTSDRRTKTLRVVNGLLFVLLGWYYLFVAWPMIIWDRPARIFFVLTALAPPVVAAMRLSSGRPRRSPTITARILAGSLGVILLTTAALTLLRAGFITLKGDRVAMVLAVTGETRLDVPRPAPPMKSWTEPVPVHHVILFLPDGTAGADMWIPGTRVAFVGEAHVFPSWLNEIGFPNLYKIQSVDNGAWHDDKTSLPYVSDLPHLGPLAVRPSWIPFQRLVLEVCATFMAMHTIGNASPDYPLVNPDGIPLKKDFLFDITLDGIPTSRFTSPLEKR